MGWWASDTATLYFDNVRVPVENLIGEEGKGFKYILTGLNAERALIAAECIGDGYWFTDKVTDYVRERQVFGRPIGQNQGVQFPLARAYAHMMAAEAIKMMPHFVKDLRINHMIEGIGHWTQQEAPDEVNAQILAFLKSVDTGK